MKRVIIICEGPTEVEFCAEILGPELSKREVYVEAPLIGNCIAMDIGLEKIQEKCPLFNEWVKKIEVI